VQEWITAVGARTAYIERGSPWENGYIESFNASLRDELVNGESFYSLCEAQIVIESWRRHCNTIRRTHRSVTSRPHEKCSYLPSQRGRLRYDSHAAETTASKLTFQPDHSVGADHVSIVRTIKAPVPVRAEDGLDPPYLHGR
jgi:putative transposase